MKITMLKVLNVKDELDALFRKDIPISASWKISKFIKQIESEYERFELSRGKIFEKYMDKEENKIPEDKKEDVKKDMDELLNMETDLMVDPIDIRELGNISVPPLSLAKMHFLFVEMPEIEPGE